MGNYVTSDEVKAKKVAGKVVDLTAYTDAEIDAEIESTELAIEALTGDIFYEKTETNLFDGNGLTQLHFVPKIPYRLLTITTLKELDIDGTTVLDTFVEGDDYKQYPFYVETTLTVDGDSPRRRFGTGGVWPKGQNNIEIAGTWGRAEVPTDIKKAATLLTIESLMPGSARLTHNSVKQATWSDFTVTFKGLGADEAKGLSTGFLEIDLILERYTNFSSLFLAVPNEKQSYD